MSDTTDTLMTAASVAVADKTTRPAAAGGVSARDLVRLVQGLYFIFWGVLVTVVVGTQVLVSLWNRSFTEVFLAAGVVSILIGSLRLAQVKLERLQPALLGRLWERRARVILRLAMLLAYFGVLFFMWRGAVGSVYLQVNALAFVVAVIVYLIILSRTVAALAAGLGSDELAMESRLFNVGNVGLLLLPCLLALIYLAVMTVQHGTNLLVEFSILLSRLSLLVAMVFLLPLSLTLSVVWAAKDIALRRLAEIDLDRDPDRQEGSS